MDEFRVSHLPVVKGKEFIGIISEEDILNMNDPEKQIGKQKIILQRPFIYDHQHVYEALKLMSTLKLTVLPVLNADEEFTGMLTDAELLQALSTTASLESPGGILILELNINDYALSQIARIVESEDAKILSLHITSHPDSTKLELTLKINKSDLSAIIASLERFKFTVKSSFHESKHDDDLRLRYDALMNYLKD